MVYFWVRGGVGFCYLEVFAGIIRWLWRNEWLIFRGKGCFGRVGLESGESYGEINIKVF